MKSVLESHYLTVSVESLDVSQPNVLDLIGEKIRVVGILCGNPQGSFFLKSAVDLDYTGIEVVFPFESEPGVIMSPLKVIFRGTLEYDENSENIQFSVKFSQVLNPNFDIFQFYQVYQKRDEFLKEIY